MRALSLTQPWATLVVIGAKKIETRWEGFGTFYRGTLLIHAAKSFPRDARFLCLHQPFAGQLIAAGYFQRFLGVNNVVTDMLPLGAIVGIANLHKVGEIIRRSDGAVMVRGRELPVVGDELAFGDFSPGRKGLILTNAAALKKPIPCRGALGLWEVPADVLAEIRKQGVAV